MKCPKCRSDNSRVMQTWSTANTVRRRRSCDDCGFRWNTWESSQRPDLKRDELEAAVRDFMGRAASLLSVKARNMEPEETALPVLTPVREPAPQLAKQGVVRNRNGITLPTGIWRDWA